jgi:arsenate reductase
MAEALAGYHLAKELRVASAGLRPLGYVPEETTEVLAEIGIPTQGLRSKGLEELELERFQLILNLAGCTLEDRPLPGFSGRMMHWYVRDPYQGSLDSYRRTRDAIEWLVTERLLRWIR